MDRSLRRSLGLLLLLAAQLALPQSSAWAQDPAPAATEEEAKPGVLTKPPQLVQFVEAVRPPGRDQEAASVVLSIAIKDDGAVEAVEVVTSGGSDFDAAAVAAAQKFRFSPAEIDGQAAPVKITYRYNFVVKTEVVKLGPQVNFEGVVVERFAKKKPIAGVKLRIKDLGVEILTDSDGRFSFVELPLGLHKIELSGAELVPVNTEELIEAGKKKTVRYLVEKREEGVDDVAVVRAARVKKESVQTVIRTEEARRVPGTQGDTLKVVQNLPGVARSSAGSGDLIVWGSSPKETKVSLDGVEIPALFHIGGLRSTISSELVGSIELLPGAYGADFGRAIGGLVRIATRPLPEKGIHGVVGADLLDAYAMLSAAVSKRFRIAAAGRYSYLDRLLPLFTKQDVGDIIPIPVYSDYQLMLSGQLRKDEELTAMFLGSSDRLQRTIPSADPGQRRSQTNSIASYRGFIRYSRILPDGASLVLSPFVGRDLTSNQQSFGQKQAFVNVDALRFGLRSSYRRKLVRFATLSLGVDVLGTKASVGRYGSVNRPAQEYDINVFGQPPGDDIAQDSWKNLILDLGPYAFVELTFGRFTITPGVRIDAYLIDGDRVVPASGTSPPVGFTRLVYAADPRVQISWKPVKRFSATLSSGIYHQAPEPEDLGAVFGNPGLGLLRAIHASLGGQLRLWGTLSLEAVGYFKYLDSLVVRSPLPSPALAQALVQEGIGRSYGGQLLLRQELLKGFFGWVSYSLSRSERRDHPASDWRLFGYDQTHALTVVASYEWRGYGAGVRFRYATGAPRTPVIGAFYDGKGDQYQPLFGAQNSTRLGDFVQLDLRLEKTFSFRRAKLNIFADVQNLTNQKNPEELIYNYNYREPSYITGLPILAVLGAKLQF